MSVDYRSRTQFPHMGGSVHIVPVSLYVVAAYTVDHQHFVWNYYPRFGSGTMTTMHARMHIRTPVYQEKLDAKRVDPPSLNEPASRKGKEKEAWAALEVT